jgi:hypothetical protein
LNRRRAAALTLAIVLTLSGAAAATTLAALSWNDLAARAARVALVTALRTTTVEHRGLPTTLVTCRVEKNFRGGGNSLTLRLPGGKRGELTMRVPGAPLPEVGDRFVVFAEAEPEGNVLRPIGFGAGMFELVERDGAAWLVQTLARAPQVFTACQSETDLCRDRLGALTRPLEALDALLIATPFAGKAKP